MGEGPISVGKYRVLRARKRMNILRVENKAWILQDDFDNGRARKEEGKEVITKHIHIHIHTTIHQSSNTPAGSAVGK